MPAHAHAHGGPATPLGKIVSGAVMIFIGFFPLFLISGGLITGFIPRNNLGVIIALAACGLIFAGGIYNVVSGVRMRKAAKLLSLRQ